MCGGRDLLGGRVFGDSLGSFGDGVLGEFSWQKKTDSRLDFPRSDRGSLVVVRKSGGFCGNALEDVVHEGVHDGHGLGADPGVRVDLLQNFVDVNGIGLLALSLPLLVALRNVLLGLSSLLRSLSACLRWHPEFRE